MDLLKGGRPLGCEEEGVVRVWPSTGSAEDSRDAIRMTQGN